MIKIENISNYDYEQVLVGTPDGQQQYDTIPANTESVYRTFDSGYRYAYVEAFIGGEEYVNPPIDFVGEQLLEPGKYTYVIDAKDDPQQYN